MAGLAQMVVIAPEGKQVAVTWGSFKRMFRTPKSARLFAKKIAQELIMPILDRTK